jgi:hypothetical protein
MQKHVQKNTSVKNETKRYPKSIKTGPSFET